MLTIAIEDEAVLLRWQTALLGWVRGDQPDLTNRQMAMLLIVGLDPKPHTVRGLATRLGVTKPVVSRALDRLGELGLLERIKDKRDGRNIFVAVTKPGLKFLKRFAGLLGSTAADTNTHR